MLLNYGLIVTKSDKFVEVFFSNACLRAAAVSIKVMLRHCDEGRMTPILL